MAKFRKKPVVIEAIQITDATFDDPHPNPDHIQGVVYDPAKREARIPTLEGEMVGSLGDWIIKGVNGEFYPCKPDIFEKTYSPADGETFQEKVIKELSFGMGNENEQDIAFVALWVSRRLSDNGYQPTFCNMADEPLTDTMRLSIAQALQRLAEMVVGPQNTDAPQDS